MHMSTEPVKMHLHVLRELVDEVAVMEAYKLRQITYSSEIYFINPVKPNKAIKSIKPIRAL